MKKPLIAQTMTMTVVGITAIIGMLLWSAHRDTVMFQEMCDKYELYC